MSKSSVVAPEASESNSPTSTKSLIIDKSDRHQHHHHTTIALIDNDVDCNKLSENDHLISGHYMHDNDFTFIDADDDINDESSSLIQPPTTARSSLISINNSNYNNKIVEKNGKLKVEEVDVKSNKKSNKNAVVVMRSDVDSASDAVKNCKNEAVRVANLHEGHHHQQSGNCNNDSHNGPTTDRLVIIESDDSENNMKISENDDKSKKRSRINNNNNDHELNKNVAKKSSLAFMENEEDLTAISENMDPYAELEIYLEKVKNEITEVFEQLKISEKTEFHEEPPKCVSTFPRKRDFSKTKKELSTRKYFEYDDWSNMKKFDDMIENEIKSLIIKNEQLDMKLNPNSTTSLSSSTSISTTSSSSTSGATVNDKILISITKPEKQTFLDFGSNTDKKPPIDTSKKYKITPSYKKFDPVLKIDEDLLYVNKDSDDLKETSTQTSPVLGGHKCGNGKESVWTSDESILLKINDNVDEDNKSTSSSACEDGSTMLSSGKSGNSLDSNSELDNAESGIGTATPPKDVDSWKHLCDNNSWIRRESVMTQTTPVSIRPLKTMRGISRGTHDDPDLLEVLSLYDGNESEIEDYREGSTDTLDNAKSIDLSFGTDSSSSEVVLRHKNDLHIDDDFKNDVSRNAISFPANLKTSSNSLPLTKRGATSNVTFNLNNDKNSIVAKRRQFFLPLEQEPFQNNVSNMVDLPSPSSASLHSGHGNLMVEELGIKSNSAPILLKKEAKKDYCEQNILRYSRSQSDRYLAEIEAIEACKWLRAAGFPQYAQMYEDLQFPIDLSGVAKDHPFLENDPLQSLYRRLVALNRCATMRLDSQHKQHGNQQDDSDDDSCALSEAWTFQHKSRRWSRVDEIGPIGVNLKQNNNTKIDDDPSRDSTPDRLSLEQNDENLGFQTLPLGLTMPLASNAEHEMMNSVRFRRTGSERLKDGAKALLRRVESIKSRRRKRQNREGVVISGPQVLDLTQMNQKMNDLKCVDLISISNPPSPLPASPSHTPFSSQRSPAFIYQNDLKVYPGNTNTGLLSPNHLSPSHFPSNKPRKSHSTRASPLHFFSQLKDSKSGDDSSSYCSEDSSGGGSSSNYMQSKPKKPPRTRRFLQRPPNQVEDISALSDSECHPKSKKKFSKDTSSKELQLPKISRGGSLNLGKESKRYREAFSNRSMRSKSAMRNQDFDSDRDDEIIVKSNRGPVVRWHSFQSTHRPEQMNLRIPSFKKDKHDIGMNISAMSCGQLQVVRKLALVTLTGYMERYCPTHRTGWNWELPKFIKKIKSPDYKDKKVFGVPLLLSLQRSGQTLPKGIQAAIKWLKLNALDQIGLFRKSGVKSRIAKLKSIVETSQDENMLIFDDQQAYDVADMVKQYFRELPESLLTTKLSETFVAIFQHLPPEVRTDAVQSAVLLLPDEHREVLFSVLEFLSQIAENSKYNQMTANNLAVCLSPSLFHNGVAANRTTSASPRRKKPTGIPDPKDLSETRASHDCLTYLIQNYRSVYNVSNERMSKCSFGYMEESKPVPLETLGEGLQVQNWCGYLYECTKATIKEGREKSRGWMSSTSFDSNVDILYKKVGDGHPLRLWKCTTEVEAPPTEVLHHVLKERHLWDMQMLKWRVIEQLDNNSEVFQYACGGQNVTDYCVLRSWNSNLPRGACVIVETSVEHQDANLLLGGVRGVVLASRYLIEPCGSGKSRIMHLARVDTKGRTPEWYNKSYGHLCSQNLAKIRSFFEHKTEGPESKV